MPALWLPFGFGSVSDPKPNELDKKPAGGRFDPKSLKSPGFQKSVPCEVVKRGGKFVAVPVSQLTAADKAWLDGAENAPQPSNGNHALKKAS